MRFGGGSFGGAGMPSFFLLFFLFLQRTKWVVVILLSRLQSPTVRLHGVDWGWSSDNSCLYLIGSLWFFSCFEGDLLMELI